MMKFFSLLIFFIPTLMMAQEADDILGVWLTDDGEAKIEIFKKDGKFNGKVVWLKEPNDKNGEPKVDTENPEDYMRQRPIMGLNLVWGFTFDDDQWEGGEIYDPKEGKTYDCRIRLKRNKLEVRGYVGAPMFGRTVVWTRTNL